MNQCELSNLIKIFFNEYSIFLEICKKEKFEIDKKKIEDEKDSCEVEDCGCEDDCSDEEEDEVENVVLNYAIYFSFMRLTLFFQTIIDAFYLKQNKKILDKEAIDLENVLKWMTSLKVISSEEESHSIATAVIFAQETNNSELNNEFYTYDSENYFSPILTPEIIALTIETLVKIVEKLEKTK